MQVVLKNPELEKFIRDHLKAGHFPSPEAAIEAAIEQMMLDQQSWDDLDPETRAAIERGEAQAERGEGMPLDEAFARLRQKHLGT